MNKMGETFDLFSVPIHAHYANLDNQAMAKYCLSMMEKGEGKEVKRSNEGGWQSKDLQGKHDVLNDLFITITDTVNKFIYELDMPDLKISNIWININGYKDFNREHTHPSSILSGVYYVQTHENCGGITFTNPNRSEVEGYWFPQLRADKNNPKVCSAWRMPAETGKLYVFPSWLSHSVDPNLDKNKKRISISWNSVPANGG